jgi:hypothetical protein
MMTKWEYQFLTWNVGEPRISEDDFNAMGGQRAGNSCSSGSLIRTASASSSGQFHRLSICISLWRARAMIPWP